jgi:allophanate hydrolase
MQYYDPDDEYARNPQQLWLLANQPSWPTGTVEQPVRYGLPPASLLTPENLSPAYHTIFERFLATLPALLNSRTSSTFNYAPFAAANAMLYDSSIVTQRLVAIKPFLPALADPQSTSTIQTPDDDPFDVLHPVIRSILHDPTPASAVKAYEDIFRLQRHKAAAHQEFRSPIPSSPSSVSAASEDTGIDVLIVPSTTLHPTVEQMLADSIALNKRLGTFTHFVNLLDLCAVAVPLRGPGATWKSENGKTMPFGVTLIALPGRDRELMALGERVMGTEIGV